MLLCIQTHREDERIDVTSKMQPDIRKVKCKLFKHFTHCLFMPHCVVHGVRIYKEQFAIGVDILYHPALSYRNRFRLYVKQCMRTDIFIIKELHHSLIALGHR